jgi:hypothetical protein
MKKILLFALILLGSVLIILSCNYNDDNFTKSNEFKNKLSIFEKSLNNSNFQAKKNTLIKNNYDGYGLLILDLLNKCGHKIDTLITTNYNKENLDIFITNELNKINIGDLTFNENENLLIESFVKHFNSENKDLIISEYETFSINNFSNQSEIKNFLIALSVIKYTSDNFNTNNGLSNERCYNCWEMCTNICMRQYYGNMNPVRWTAFFMNPGASVLWNYSDCAWECGERHL